MGYNINVEEWNEFTSSFVNVGVGYARWRIIMASVNRLIKNRKAKSLSRIYAPIPNMDKWECMASSFGIVGEGVYHKITQDPPLGCTYGHVLD